MDVPLPVWGDEIQHQTLAIHETAAYVGRVRGFQFRFVGGEMLPEVQIPRMVQVEVLAARQRSPGNQALHVDAPGSIGSALVHYACPTGAGECTADLASNIKEVYPNPPILFCQVCQR